MDNGYLEYIEEYKHKYMKCYKDDKLVTDFSILDVSQLTLNYSKISKIIPGDRFDKFIRLKNEADRKLFFGTEILLQDGCKKNGVAYRERKYDEYGKPYIDNSNIYFNISHSGEYGLCCFSNHRNGCDIQLIGEDLMDVAKRFFNKEEVVRLLEIKEEKDEKSNFI